MKLMYIRIEAFRLQIKRNGTMAFCVGKCVARRFPGIMRYSQMRNMTIRTRLMARGTRTFTEDHGQYDPPHVKAKIKSPKPNRKRNCPPKSNVPILCAKPLLSTSRVPSFRQMG
jgi:hypothetical protein